MISLLSLSRAVQLHGSPAPSTGFFVPAMSFCFAPVKFQMFFSALEAADFAAPCVVGRGAVEV